MSSFTSKTVRDLYEAYNSVYVDKTELFLNDILDEVTDIINHFVNEGYDFSEYSWDELYESFLENVLEPELEEVENFITQLNESTEELTEEQIDNLLQEKLGGLLSGVGNLLKGRQAVQTATQTATRAPKPSILQAPLVKLGTTAPSPKPSSNPLYAPGVSSGRTTRPSVTPPPGADKGTFQRIGDWVSSLSKTTKVKSPAAPAAPAKPASQPASQPPAKQPPAKQPPASGQPSGTPQRQQGWPSLGLRDKASKVVQALTPGPKVKGLAKYVGAPLGTIGATGALVGDISNLASNKSSDLRKISGWVQGGIGNVSQATGHLRNKIGSESGNTQIAQGEWWKQQGDKTQVDNERKRSGQPAPPRPRRGTPPKIEDVKEKVDPIEIYNRQGNLQKVTPGKGYPITKGGKRGYVVYDTSGKPKFTEYPTQPTPAAQSPAPKPSTDPGAKQPGESLRDYAIRTEREASQAQPPAATTTPAPAPAPSQQPPAATTTPAPAPRPTTQVPTEPSKVSPSKPAQTGDRTKDLTTWATTPRNRNMINTVGTPQQKAILSAADKGTAMPAPRPISKDVEDIRKMQAASRERQGVKESYDAYDLVLEYLLSQGHVESLDEALYVMMEMDAEMIGTIVEAAADQSDKQIDTGVKTTYKAQNVLDNQHQGRSKGLNKLPRGEREEKAKRMQGRLKARRDDLFGERNKREDSKREQLKKMLGL